MAKIKKWAPVIIHWGDAVTVSEPASSDDEFEVAERVSIGFLIKRNKTGVVIAMEDDRNCADFGENDCQTVTTIPRGMVRKITALMPMPETAKNPKQEPDAVA